MDKIDEYNFEQIKRIYTEHKSILFLIRIIKEAKVDYGKNKAYIEELENDYKVLENDYLKLQAKINLIPDINREARIEARKEELYNEIKRNLKTIDEDNRKLRQINSTLIGQLNQLKK